MNKLARMKNSRNSWKEKARERADKIREARKLKKKQSLKISELRAKNKTLKEKLSGEKKG